MSARTSWQNIGVVLVVLAGALVSPGAGWAGSKFKTLYTFTGDNDGSAPVAGLIFDQAGNLYGTTAAGGSGTGCNSNNCGTVFKLTPNGDGSWTKSVIHSFNNDGVDGQGPNTDLTFDQAGNLYGTTPVGGKSSCPGGVVGCGIIFQLTPNSDGSWTENVIHSFSGTDGQLPAGPLILDQAGGFYGTTAYGGRNNCNDIGCGTVFRLTPNGDGTWRENILHSFRGADGSNPGGSLVLDGAGNLQGTTSNGGADTICPDCGTVFQLTPKQDGSWKETVLHSFHRYDGVNPFAGVISDTAGNLYGTTPTGGPNGYGTVFKLRPNAKGGPIITVLNRFNGSNGLEPEAGLVFDLAGNLYGTTFRGGNDNFGTVFSLKPNANGAWKETVLRSFKDRPGSLPVGTLILDGKGNLYGTTLGDGLKTFGSVFEVTP